MKTTWLVLILCFALPLSSCTTRTKYGECVGVVDKEKPDLEYKLSKWNIFLGVVFAETIIVPIVVAVDDVKCPVGTK